MTVWEDGYFVGGHVALDLCNTVHRRTPKLGPDLLDGPASLGGWLERTGVLSGSSRLPDGSVLRDVLDLREALWQAVDAQRMGHTVGSDALAVLLAHAHAGRRHLAVGPDGTATTTDARGAVAVLALAGLTLLLAPPREPLRACDGCGWLYLDTSRGRRRRWCSMRTCGNEHKVARHRARERASLPAD